MRFSESSFHQTKKENSYASMVVALGYSDNIITELIGDSHQYDYEPIHAPDGKGRR